MDTKGSAENENRCKHRYEEVSSPVSSSGDGDSYPPDIKGEYFTGYYPSNRSLKKKIHGIQLQKELLTSLPPAVGKVENKEADEEDNEVAYSFAGLLILFFLTNSESHNEGSS